MRQHAHHQPRVPHRLRDGVQRAVTAHGHHHAARITGTIDGAANQSAQFTRLTGYQQFGAGRPAARNNAATCWTISRVSSLPDAALKMKNRGVLPQTWLHCGVAVAPGGCQPRAQPFVNASKNKSNKALAPVHQAQVAIKKIVN